jgi:hypothetical protein
VGKATGGAAQKQRGLMRKIGVFRRISMSQFWLENSFARRQGDSHSCPKRTLKQPTEGG